MSWAGLLLFATTAVVFFFVRPFFLYCCHFALASFTRHDSTLKAALSMLYTIHHAHRFTHVWEPHRPTQAPSRPPPLPIPHYDSSMIENNIRKQIKLNCFHMQETIFPFSSIQRLAIVPINDKFVVQKLLPSFSIVACLPNYTPDPMRHTTSLIQHVHQPILCVAFDILYHCCLVRICHWHRTGPIHDSYA